VIGNNRRITELATAGRQNLFQLMFRRFLGVFARKEHPLALFSMICNGWMPATLDLLEHLVTHPEVRHLLLVGAYRTTRSPRAPPFRRGGGRSARSCEGP